MMSPEQRMAALANADVVRLGIARVKREIREGLDPAVALAHPDAQRGRVQAILMAFNGIGEKHAAWLMLELGLPDRKRVGELTDRQKDVLADKLRESLRRRAA